MEQINQIRVAINEGKTQVAKKLIAKIPNVNEKINGKTLLLWILGGYRYNKTKTEIIEFLIITRGADVNAVDESYNSPLLLASKDPAAVEIIKLLIKHGAKVIINDSGENALYFAIKCDQSAEIRNLIREATR